MNQAVRKTRKTNWSPPGWTGPPLNISKIHPRTGLYSEADSFLFNGMTGCYDNANVAALTGRRIVSHAGAVNRAFADGYIAGVSGTWNAAVEGPDWVP